MQGTEEEGAALLGWWVSHEINALGDVAFQALDGDVNQLPLLAVGFLEDIDCLLCSSGLNSIGQYRNRCLWKEDSLTPSSTGTEKKSHPIFFAISSPPETPGR